MESNRDNLVNETTHIAEGTNSSVVRTASADSIQKVDSAEKNIKPDSYIYYVIFVFCNSLGITLFEDGVFYITFNIIFSTIKKESLA